MHDEELREKLRELLDSCNSRNLRTITIPIDIVYSLLNNLEAAYSGIEAADKEIEHYRQKAEAI